MPNLIKVRHKRSFISGFEIVQKNLNFVSFDIGSLLVGGFTPLFFYTMLSESVYHQIEKLASEAIPEAYLVDVQLLRGDGSLLSIKADTDKGISLQECAKISRRVGAWLEQEDIFDFKYRLEVSSPGIGSPLTLLRQYKNNIGRALQVLLLDGTQLEGILGLVDDESLVLMPFPIKKNTKKRRKSPVETIEKHHILFNDIKRSKVIIR